MDYSHQEDLAITGGLGSNRDLKNTTIKRRRNYRFKKEKKF
jgi:hypothetical protein